MAGPKSPADLVQEITNLLMMINFLQRHRDRDEGQIEEKTELIGNHMFDLNTVLCQITTESPPLKKDYHDLTQEFFKGDAFRLLINSLPILSQEARTRSVHLVTKLLQPSSSDYLRSNLDLIDTLLTGYRNHEEIGKAQTLNYGKILQECIRHMEVVAAYVTQSPAKMKRFFDYILIPNYPVSADAGRTFRLLLTNYKPVAARFLSENQEWFFEDYNVKLLGSTDINTRCFAMKLLSEILSESLNERVMRRYVGSAENLKWVMDVLEVPNKWIQVYEFKWIQVYAFRVFRLFVTAQERPSSIVEVLRANKDRTVQLLKFEVGVSLITMEAKEKVVLGCHKDQVIRELAKLG